MPTNQDIRLEQYYAGKPEPYQGCLLALRDIILNINDEIVQERKFQIPFFTYRDKKLGYLWLNKKKLMLGFCLDKRLQTHVEGQLCKDKYESIEIDANEDLPVDFIITNFRRYISIIDGAAGQRNSTS